MPAGNRLVGEEAPPSLSSNLGCILSPNTRSPTSLQGHGRKDTFRGKRTFLLHPPLLNFPFCICNFPSVYEPSKGMTRPCVERGVVYFRFDSMSKEKYYLRYYLIVFIYKYKLIIEKIIEKNVLFCERNISRWNQLIMEYSKVSYLIVGNFSWDNTIEKD